MSTQAPERPGPSVAPVGIGAEGFKMPFFPVANYLVLAFLAGVVVLMGFLPDFRYALYVAPVWVATLFVAYRVKTSAALRARAGV